MTLGFIENVKIKDKIIKVVELVTKIPEDYNFVREFKKYKIYEKQEMVDNDIHHYFLACKNNL